jgi:23S rRNA pseudouridine1911/1915/1917 synthase
MVFARTAEAERRLVQMFSKHDLHRAYVAIVHGQIQAQTIESYLVRDRGDGLRGTATRPGEGQRAVTHVRPLESLEGYTLVECRLETGRTHQIRIHLAEAGHVVCGDKVYVRPLHGKPVEDRSGAQRQALHAAELGFTHPVTGKRLEFQMPIPADMERLLDRLRSRKP